MGYTGEIQRWRDANPGERLTEACLLTILEAATLRRVDLRDANLRGANLPGANLRDASLSSANLSGASLCGANLTGANLARADLAVTNLRYADLTDADLRYANLWGADLRDADLRYANLIGADLRGANLHNNRAGILTVDGAHPYQATLVPTPGRWVLAIECWHGTADELRALISQNKGWPEATGEEIGERRPILEAIADLCDLHIGRHAELIDDLAKKWDS